MSLVAFKARNHPQQAKRDDVDDRGTHREFWDELHAERRFTIDVAANADNALLPRYWTRADDALLQPWSGERVWCNPPYSDLEPWVEKAWMEMLADEPCESVAMLLPANRCEQGFWQRHIEPYRDGEPYQGICLTTQFLAGRMRFRMPEDYVWGPSCKRGDRPPFGCVLLTWRRVRSVESEL